MAQPGERKRPPEFIAEARRLWIDGLTAQEIGARLGVSKGVIMGLKRRNGFPEREYETQPGRLETWSRDQLERAEALLFDGHTYDQVASAIGVTAKQVEHHRTKYGWMKRSYTNSEKPRVRRPEAPRIANRPKVAPAPDKPLSANSGGVTDGCKWLYGEPTDLAWCGRERVEGTSWCPAHLDRVYLKHPVKRSGEAFTINLWPSKT